MVTSGETSTPVTVEDLAAEYHVNRRLAGNWAPRPPIETWPPEARERFEAELERLEREDL